MPRMCYHTRLASHGVVRIVGAETFTAMVPDAAAVATHIAQCLRGCFSLFFSYMWFNPTLPDLWTRGLLVIGGASSAWGDNTRRRA
jgi:hypothetical protein